MTDDILPDDTAAPVYPAVTVEELKAQLNLDHDLDDALLSLKIDAAKAYCSSFIAGEISYPVPPAIKQAILMLAAHWYENREAVLTGGNAYIVPFGVHDLLGAHRAWVV